MAKNRTSHRKTVHRWRIGSGAGLAMQTSRTASLLLYGRRLVVHREEARGLNLIRIGMAPTRVIAARGVAGTRRASRAPGNGTGAASETSGNAEEQLQPYPLTQNVRDPKNKSPGDGSRATDFCREKGPKDLSNKARGTFHALQQERMNTTFLVLMTDEQIDT